MGLKVKVEEEAMARMRHSTTEYNIKIADLSCDSNFTSSELNEKIFEKFLKKRQFFYPYKLYISIDMNINDVLKKDFKSLRDLRAAFKTNEDCKKFLEELIWEGEPISPFDKSSKVYQCKDGWYKCKNTGKEFNILTGTLFQNSKIELPIWFEIIFRENSDKTGLASTTIAREYGISQKAAWNMLQKIRNAMGKENHQKLKDVVEVDEYYEGGSLKNMHYDKKLAVKKEGTNQNKKLLQGFVQRGGDAVIRVIPDKSDDTLVAGVLRYVEKNSTLYSDDNPSYQKLPPLYDHSIVVHSKGNFVNKENKNIYTNTIESVWNVFERTKKTHIKVSEKHLQNYANEAVFRYNTRKMSAGDASIWFFQNIKNTNITWREIKNGEYRQYNRTQKRIA